VRKNENLTFITYGGGWWFEGYCYINIGGHGIVKIDNYKNWLLTMHLMLHADRIDIIMFLNFLLILLFCTQIHLYKKFAMQF
jgi:hypothetical protein